VNTTTRVTVRASEPHPVEGIVEAVGGKRVVDVLLFATGVDNLRARGKVVRKMGDTVLEVDRAIFGGAMRHGYIGQCEVSGQKAGRVTIAADMFRPPLG
jgi:hypothetical protein